MDRSAGDVARLARVDPDGAARLLAASLDRYALAALVKALERAIAASAGEPAVDDLLLEADLSLQRCLFRVMEEAQHAAMRDDLVDALSRLRDANMQRRTEPLPPPPG
ncbi:MAG: hypothetical protein KIT58_17850 [Planctomycetota bacterium]|nr:hypothetical protein [Planctomycetota bacterium]